MSARHAWAGGLILGLVLAGPAAAVITRLTPLKEVLASEQFIFVAKVEALDPDRPSLVLAVAEDLKGQAPFRRLPVNMTGDTESQKGDHRAQLYKRLAVGQPVVVFSSLRGKRGTAFVFSNGTWFQLHGLAGDDPATVRWSLAHGEPYLRRTFKGGTEELRQVVADGLSGKKEPPPPDSKVEPGFGPEVQPKEKKDGPQGALHPSFAAPAAPRFAVIPTVFVMGPLALLATLFPAVFGGFQRRWLVFLSIVSLDSTFYVLYVLFRGHVKDTWWGRPAVFWGTLSLCSLFGLIWSLKRYRAAVDAGEAESLWPRNGERRVLRAVSLLGLAVVTVCVSRRVLLDPPWKELMALWITVWVGSLYIFHLRRKPASARRQPVVPVEAAMLWGLVFACLAVGGVNRASAPAAATAVRVAWTFEPKDRGKFDSSPLASDDRVFVAAEHRGGFATYGALYCLDRKTGGQVWKFDADQSMRPVFCSPCLADGKLYVGEGYHQDAQCRLFCLEALSGKLVWEFTTGSHTESAPVVVDGKVYFGAGDDGVYCLEAATGKKLWQFSGPHVDARPAVAGHRLYAGGAYGQYEVFCLDTDTGQPVWRLPQEVPVFGAPVLDGEHLIFGRGNGNLLESADRPAGGVACVEAKTGRPVWDFKAPDAVHAPPAVRGDSVFFGSRDHHVYCVSRDQGTLTWRQDVGSPVVTALALSGDGRSLYAVASGGRACCLDPANGEVRWSFSVSDHAQARAQLLSSPAVVDDPAGRLILFGAGLDNLVTWTPMLFCLEEQQP